MGVHDYGLTTAHPAGRAAPTQLGRRLELRDRIQFLKRGSKCVRQTPHRPWTELVILGLEVEVMHGAGKMSWSFQSALHERLVDDHFRRDIGKFAPLPGFDLPAHRLQVPLHPIDTNGNGVDQ